MDKLDTSILSIDETLDVTNALGDPTRFGIYRMLVDAAGEYITVSEAADRFGLHPNVARMHLQKLVDVGLVSTSTRKSPGGGRPARIYRLGDRVANLQFPPRDYRLLANLALQVVRKLAAGHPEVLDQVGYEMGREEGRKALGEHGVPPQGDLDDLIEMLADTCALLGLYPRVTRGDDGDPDISIEVRNCVFRELSSSYPDIVCTLHASMLRGLLEAFLEEFHLTAKPAICTGDGACHFAVALA